MSSNIKLCPPPAETTAEQNRTEPNDDQPATPARIVKQLERIAFSDLGNVVDWTTDDEGNPKLDLRDKSRMAGQSYAIAEVSTTKSSFKVRIVDRLKALELLGKQLGMFKGEGNRESKIEVVIPEDMLSERDRECS